MTVGFSCLYAHSSLRQTPLGIKDHSSGRRYALLQCCTWQGELDPLLTCQCAMEVWAPQRQRSCSPPPGTSLLVAAWALAWCCRRGESTFVARCLWFLVAGVFGKPWVRSQACMTQAYSLTLCCVTWDPGLTFSSSLPRCTGEQPRGEVQ